MLTALIHTILIGEGIALAQIIAIIAPRTKAFPVPAEF